MRSNKIFVFCRLYLVGYDHLKPIQNFDKLTSFDTVLCAKFSNAFISPGKRYFTPKLCNFLTNTTHFSKISSKNRLSQNFENKIFSKTFKNVCWEIKCLFFCSLYLVGNDHLKPIQNFDKLTSFDTVLCAKFSNAFISPGKRYFTPKLCNLQQLQSIF